MLEAKRKKRIEKEKKQMDRFYAQPQLLNVYRNNLKIDGIHERVQGPKSKTSHSLMPYLHVYKFFEDHVGYFVMDPATKSLLGFDVGEWKEYNKVKNIL